MEFSIALASEVDSWRWAKRAEELGFSSVWFYDTQLLNPDIFVCMALAAHETSRIRLGTGVLVPSNRIEPVAANAFASLNQLAPGRIDFGVGTGFTARRTMGLGPITLGDMRSYIDRVQGLLRGETIEWDEAGQLRKIRFLNPELELINLHDEVPVWISAFGPKGQQLVADVQAGWLNFGAQGVEAALARMRDVWTNAGNDADALSSNLFFLGAVLSGDEEEDERRLMAQAAPSTAVIFHGMADEIGPMGGKGLPPGPLKDLGEAYLKIHEKYEPEDAKYLENHRGHLMFVRPEETHLNADLARATTMSGTHDELVSRLRAVKDAGYSQVTVQLVHGHESAIEDWAEVFKAVD